MGVFAGATLRQILTVPYVALVLLTAGVIALLSYNTGRNAVDTLLHHLLQETVNRIAQAVEKHVSGSQAVLETAFPTGIAAPGSIQNEIDALRTRFWLATSIHRDPNNYAYYGNQAGEFIGLWRFSENDAELRLRTGSDVHRSTYQFSGIEGGLGEPVREERIFDPRERPWYKAGEGVSNQTWTSIYIDFRSLELVGTRAKRVKDAAGLFEGVVATDLSLQHLTDFLRGLDLSENGFAYIAELDGNLIASSRGPFLRKNAQSQNERLNARDSDDASIVATHAAITKLTASSEGAFPYRTSSFVGPEGRIIEAGYSRLRDAAGLDWIVAVAVPRSDFMHDITHNLYRTIALATLASLLMAGIGFLILKSISGQLRRLAAVANDIGDGVEVPVLQTTRRDEIGELAKSFSQMQEKLLTDRLTGLANREAVIRRLESRIISHRRRADTLPLALLFIDLNGFKRVNDEFGHPVGDEVLIEIGQRIQSRLRDRDLAGRFGGDEFIVLLDDVGNRRDADKVRSMMEKLLGEPLAALQSQGAAATGIMNGAAVGFALYPDDGLDPDTLIKQADIDMYRRKRAQAGSPPAPV